MHLGKVAVLIIDMSRRLISFQRYPLKLLVKWVIHENLKVSDIHKILSMLAGGICRFNNNHITNIKTVTFLNCRL